jgi:DNA polymerase-3 subunit beta
MEQLVIDSKQLNSALRKLGPIFSGRSIMQMLENVLIKADPDGITLTATDMKLTMILQIKGINAEPFTWLLPYKELLNITGVVPGPVTIEMDEDRKAVLKSGKDLFKLGVTEDPTLYVKVPEFEADYSLDVNGTFFWSLQQAAKSTATGENELIFCCILLDFRENELRVVSSARSNMYLHKIKTDKKFKKQALFYLDFVKAVKDFEDAQLSITDKFICAKNDTLTVIATCSEQRFPNYEMLLPKEGNVVNCTVESKDLNNAMDKMMVYNSQVPLTKLSFTAEGIQVDLHDDHSNRAIDTIVPADHKVSEQIIVVNAKLLKDLISQLPPNTDTLQCIVPDNPTVIWVKPEKDEYDLTLLLGLIGQ